MHSVLLPSRPHILLSLPRYIVPSLTRFDWFAIFRRWRVNYGTKGESADGEVEMRYEGHVGAVTCIMDMTQGTQVVSGSYDKTIRVWDVESGEQLLSLKGHTGVIYGLNLSPDGFRMLSCSSDCTIKVSTSSHISRPPSSPSCTFYSKPQNLEPWNPPP